MPEKVAHGQLLDHLNTAVVLLTRELNVRYMNVAAEDLLQVSGHRMMGMCMSDLYLQADANLEAMKQTIAIGQSYTERKTEMVLLNGHSVTVDYTITPIDDEGGILLELQSLDRLLRISREEALVSSHKLSRALVRGLAHEVKNPLGGIRGAAQLLSKELPSQELTDYTEVIIEEADRLRNLVDRLLGPHQLPKMRSINIHEVVERVYALISAECGDDIVLVKDYDPSLPELQADKEQLIQALLNIARNSMQALQRVGEAQEKPCIQFRTRALRQFTIDGVHHRLVCRLDVMDNGPGIAEELLETIFYPMVSGHAEGTGLGLSIAQSAINQHGGLIACESKPGNTCFSLFLPLDIDND